MTPQKQKFRHAPEAGVWGDCHRTAIASLLDLDRDEVPNWAEMHWDDGSAFDSAVESWLRTRGLATVNVVYKDDLDRVLGTQAAVNPTAYYLLAGTSRTGVNHSVVARGGAIVLDPSLDDAGIIGPCDDGYYWVTYLVPSGMKDAA